MTSFASAQNRVDFDLTISHLYSYSEKVVIIIMKNGASDRTIAHYFFDCLPFSFFFL